MSWIEVQALVHTKTVVILPTGSIEQHGPHLPTGTDSYIGYELCKYLGQSLMGKIPFVIAPPVVYGESSGSVDFPGTLSVTSHTYIELISNLCNHLIHHGFRKILLLNSHGGNIPSLHLVVRRIRNQHKVLIAAVTYWIMASEEIGRIRESELGGIAHAGEFETSCMLAIKPHLVNRSLFERKVPRWRSNYILMDFETRDKVDFGIRTDDFSTTGVIGDPTLATKEKGKEFLKAATDALCEFIIEFGTWEVGRMTETT